MKQFGVIGIGNFGYYLATHLYDKGHDVLAIDKSVARIQEIKDRVSQAVVADATDLKAMESLDLHQMDAVIVCIGTMLSHSILATLNMNDLGVKRIYAKALTEPHGRILRKVGASEVLFPERDLAVSLGERLHNPNMLDYLPFLEGYSISIFAPPERFDGKSLRELDLINRFGVQVIAARKKGSGALNVIPTAKYTLAPGDELIVLGPDDALKGLDEKHKE